MFDKKEFKRKAIFSGVSKSKLLSVERVVMVDSGMVKPLDSSDFFDSLIDHLKNEYPNFFKILDMDKVIDHMSLRAYYRCRIKEIINYKVVR